MPDLLELPLPPVAVVVDHQLAEFDAGKRVFDANEQHRMAAGIVGHHINGGKDDPNSLSVYLVASDVDRATAFGSSDELKGEPCGTRLTQAHADMEAGRATGKLVVLP